MAIIKNMNTTQLEYFIELAYTLNYTKASEILDIAQPTLSKAIDHLEKELGYSLFVKKGRKIELSNKGQIFLAYAEKAINTLNEGIVKADRAARSINIGSVTSMQLNILPEIIKKYQDKHPDSFFIIHTDISGNLINKLIKEEIDFALCTQTTENDELVFIPIHEQKLFVALYEGHPLCNRKEITFSDLKNQNMVFHSANTAMHKVIDNIASINGFNPKIVAEADEDVGLLGLVKNKMGICIIGDAPNTIISPLIYRPLRYKGPRRFLSFVYRKKDGKNLEELIEIAKSLKNF